MPNIEIHGDIANRDLLLERIRASFKGAGYEKDIVVTIANDEAFDLCGKPRQFLRAIFAKNFAPMMCHDCMRWLSTLNMDVEVLTIHEFIPKRD